MARKHPRRHPAPTEAVAGLEGGLGDLGRHLLGAAAKAGLEPGLQPQLGQEHQRDRDPGRQVGDQADVQGGGAAMLPKRLPQPGAADRQQRAEGADQHQRGAERERDGLGQRVDHHGQHAAHHAGRSLTSAGLRPPATTSDCRIRSLPRRSGPVDRFGPASSWTGSEHVRRSQGQGRGSWSTGSSGPASCAYRPRRPAIQTNPHYAETLTGTHARHAMAIAVATAASSRARPSSDV